MLNLTSQENKLTFICKYSMVTVCKDKQAHLISKFNPSCLSKQYQSAVCEIYPKVLNSPTKYCCMRVFELLDLHKPKLL